jgi:serine/threonine-protein kinase
MWVSGGPADVRVPALSGMTLDQAKKTLEDAGLKLGSSSERPDQFVRAGLVLTQDPASGTQVPPGFSVHVVLSSGPPPTPAPTSPPATTAPPSPSPSLLPSLPIGTPTPTRSP